MIREKKLGLLKRRGMREGGKEESRHFSLLEKKAIGLPSLLILET